MFLFDREAEPAGEISDRPGRQRHPGTLLEPVGKGNHLRGGRVQANVLPTTLLVAVETPYDAPACSWLGMVGLPN